MATTRTKLVPAKDIATSNRRLRTLARFLRKLRPEKFNYGVWVGHDWKGSPDLSCGTTACALGWATTIPSFRKAGLRLQRTAYKSADGTWRRPVFGRKTTEVAGALGMPVFGRKAAEVAGASFFGITFEEAMFLFIPGGYHLQYGWSGPEGIAEPAEVADHIESFVKKRMENRALERKRGKAA